MSRSAGDDCSTAELVERFNDAWNRHDLDAAIALTHPDAVFESTSPPPDGLRYVGHRELRSAWAAIFDDASSRFTVERQAVSANHLTQLWRYDWVGGHVRGVDVITIRDGLVAEKLAYVKG